MTTRDARTLDAILDRDAALAVADAQHSYLVESCELAPLSYVAMRAMRDAGTLAGALAALPAHLLRPQAVRFLVERQRITGQRWGWGDVADVARRFQRLIDAQQQEETTMEEEPETTRRTPCAHCGGTDAPASVMQPAWCIDCVDAILRGQGEARRPDADDDAAASAAVLAPRRRPCPTCGSDGSPCPDCNPDMPACPVLVAPRRPDGGYTAAALPIPTPAQIEAALFQREESAARQIRYAHASGDADTMKLAGREAQACRDAMALLIDGAFRVTASGDLLVKSPRGMWHRVGRCPTDGASFAPILCSCEWGQKSSGLGPCKHEALFVAYYEAAESALADADAEVEARAVYAA